MPNASQIVSSMASQSTRERNPALTGILRNSKALQRARAKAGKAQLAGMTPNAVKKRVFGPLATSSPQEGRQSEPGSDAITVAEPATAQRSSPPLPEETMWNVVSSRHLTRSNPPRTQQSFSDDEYRPHKARNNTVQRRKKIRSDGRITTPPRGGTGRQNHHSRTVDQPTQRKHPQPGKRTLSHGAPRHG